MGVSLHQDGVVAILEQVTAPIVAAVETLRMNAVHVAERAGKVASRRLYERVLVIVHEAVGVAEEFEAGRRLLENAEERSAVHFVKEDGLAGVSPRRDVIEGAGILDAKGTGHGPTLRP